MLLLSLKVSMSIENFQQVFSWQRTRWKNNYLILDFCNAFCHFIIWQFQTFFFFRVQIALSLHKEIWSSLRSHNWISSWVSLGLITLKNAFRQNVRTGKSQGCFKGLNWVHTWEEVKLRFNWRGFNFCNPGNHSELKMISLPLVRRNISKIFKIGSVLKFEYIVVIMLFKTWLMIDGDIC